MNRWSPAQNHELRFISRLGDRRTRSRAVWKAPLLGGTTAVSSLTLRGRDSVRPSINPPTETRAHPIAPTSAQDTQIVDTRLRARRSVPPRPVASVLPPPYSAPELCRAARRPPFALLPPGP